MMDGKIFLVFLILHTGWVIFSLEIISDWRLWFTTLIFLSCLEDGLVRKTEEFSCMCKAAIY